MIIELASRGDLYGLYLEKQGRSFSLKLGITVVLGAARGLTYMHTMPTPVVHRDIKSMNVMVTGEGDNVTGKVGDCGESRRVVRLLCSFAARTSAYCTSVQTHIHLPRLASPHLATPRTGYRLDDDADRVTPLGRARASLG